MAVFIRAADRGLWIRSGGALLECNILQFLFTFSRVFGFKFLRTWPGAVIICILPAILLWALVVKSFTGDYIGGDVGVVILSIMSVLTTFCIATTIQHELHAPFLMYISTMMTAIAIWLKLLSVIKISGRASIRILVLMTGVSAISTMMTILH